MVTSCLWLLGAAHANHFLVSPSLTRTKLTRLTIAKFEIGCCAGLRQAKAPSWKVSNWLILWFETVVMLLMTTIMAPVRSDFGVTVVCEGQKKCLTKQVGDLNEKHVCQKRVVSREERRSVRNFTAPCLEKCMKATRIESGCDI